MKISTHRLDRYAAIAACGSGAVGVAVSPLHGDIQYFESNYTMSLPGGTNTSGSDFATFSGGDLSWFVGGSRFQSYSLTSGSFSTISYFSQWRQFYSTNLTTWFATGATFAQNLVNAGDLIDLAAIQSGTAFATLHYRLNFASSYSSVFSSTGTFVTSNFSSSSGSTSSGRLAPGERGFLGLGFQLDGETVFGWADISLSTDGLSLTVHGWAFEDSGEAIVAGQTEGGGTPVPGLGGLAALACGAAGMRRKRDRVA